MGCFSFKCLECGRGVRSSSFTGELVHLFLLKEGKIIQKMTGAYDSYGRVFINGTQRKGVRHKLRESREWSNPTPDIPFDSEKVEIIGEEHAIWLRVCDLMNSKDFTNGLAAVHVKCFKKDPIHRSPSDPEQGWGSRKKKIAGYDPLKELMVDDLRDKMWHLKDRISFGLLVAIDIVTGKRNEIRAEIIRQQKEEYAKMKAEYLSLGGELVNWMGDY